MKWIIKAAQPKDKISFTIYLESNAVFKVNIPDYHLSVLNYSPYRYALYEYKESFVMLYELMTKYNSDDVIPPLSNKDNGLIKSWLKPLGSYGGVVHSSIESKTCETLSDYLEGFFKVIEIHTRFAQRAKQLQLSFLTRDNASLEARSMKPLRDTSITNGRRAVNNLNEYQHELDSSIFIDEIDQIMAHYEEQTGDDNSVDSMNELDRRMTELNYVSSDQYQRNNSNPVKFDKLLRRADDRDVKEHSGSPHRNTDSGHKKKPCYIHLLLRSKGKQAGCTKPDCPYSHTDESMEELWKEVSTSMKHSPFKPKGINNLNSIEDQEL
jgi:hypothetical protein